MFFSVGLTFIYLSLYLHNDLGQIFCLLVITTAATDTAIGLSLLIVAYRLGDKVTYDSLTDTL
jgi:NADH-quinone oxidoreductase subunit K